MNTLRHERRRQILGCLCEGTSIRAIERLTGTSKRTILNLLAEVGEACQEYQHEALVNLPCKRVQCDEVWSFCYAKEKNVPAEYRGTFGYGDVWTWTAICADTKLIPSWFVGTRDAGSAYEFMSDLAGRLANRIQLTTDGHKPYLTAVGAAFGHSVDYAMLVKIYGPAPEEEARRYSPGQCIGCEPQTIRGYPDPAHISTSYVERSNLSIRMHTRRFARLTNAHSKKLANHCHALALYFMYYNFCRVHSTIRCTPAMEAGVADHIWELDEVLGLLPEKRRLA